MKFDDFKREVKAEIEGKCPPDVTIKEHKVVKHNDNILFGLIFEKEGRDEHPTFYLNDIYRDFIEGDSIEDVAERIIAIVEESRPPEPFENFIPNDKEEMFKATRIMVLERDRNTEYLKTVPCKSAGAGFLKTLFLNVDLDEGSLMARVNKDMAKSNDFPLEDLFDAAEENISPFVFGLDDFVLDPELATQENLLQKGSLPKKPLVITEKAGHDKYGASAFFKKGVAEEIERKLGTGYFVLPSSVHEMIMFPVEKPDPDTVKNMKRTVLDGNAHLDESEILSDHVYYFSDGTLKVMA